MAAVRPRFALVACCLVALVAAAPAQAGFPGTNGKIAYELGGGWTGPNNAWYLPGEIHVMNSDGSGDLSLGRGAFPNWSPDGTKIAFSNGAFSGGGIYVMNADGSDNHRINPTGPGFDLQPAWSPAGDKLAFVHESCPSDPAICFTALETINADGTGLTEIVPIDKQPQLPVWSPDGTKIAMEVCASGGTGIGFCDDTSSVATVNPDGFGYTEILPSPGELISWSGPDWSPDGRKLVVRGSPDASTPYGDYIVNPDGSGPTRTNGPAGLNPMWSPDRAKIAYHGYPNGCCQTDVFTMNLDGSNPTQLTSNANSHYPDWQPVPYTGYARPRGASPSQIFLVPAYAQCTAPNRSHGAPLSNGSCAPPTQIDSGLTVGTPDANGQGANSFAKVVYTAQPGDLAIYSMITDVRNRSDLTDYTGHLRLLTSFRITDRDNTPAPGSATGLVVPLPTDITCSPTAATTTGSQCELSTSVNALIPDAITAGKRAIWEFGQVQVYDSGSDGLGPTIPSKIFMVQGVFVP